MTHVLGVWGPSIEGAHYHLGLPKRRGEVGPFARYDILAYDRRNYKGITFPVDLTSVSTCVWPNRLNEANIAVSTGVVSPVSANVERPKKW